jgi:hypothetical protein
MKDTIKVTEHTHGNHDQAWISLVPITPEDAQVFRGADLEGMIETSHRIDPNGDGSLDIVFGNPDVLGKNRGKVMSSLGVIGCPVELAPVEGLAETEEAAVIDEATTIEVARHTTRLRTVGGHILGRVQAGLLKTN